MLFFERNIWQSFTFSHVTMKCVFRIFSYRHRVKVSRTEWRKKWEHMNGNKTKKKFQLLIICILHKKRQKTIFNFQAYFPHLKPEGLSNIVNLYLRLCIFEFSEKNLWMSEKYSRVRERRRRGEHTNKLWTSKIGSSRKIRRNFDLCHPINNH